MRRVVGLLDRREAELLGSREELCQRAALDIFDGALRDPQEAADLDQRGAAVLRAISDREHAGLGHLLGRHRRVLDQLAGGRDLGEEVMAARDERARYLLPKAATQAVGPGVWRAPARLVVLGATVGG